MDDDHVVGDTDRGTRERQRNKTTREQNKLARYANKDPNLINFKIACKHKAYKRFKCNLFTKNDIQDCRQKFFKHADKIKQDTILSHLISITKPKRRKNRSIDTTKNRKVLVKYKLKKGSEELEVCQKMWLCVFSISQKRAQTVTKQVKDGHGILENRGGDSKSQKFLPKRLKIRAFIKNLKGKESHYGRKKSRRIYLSSELNITVLHKLYNNSVDDEYKVQYKYFSRIFNKEFNIGFGSPATDICGFCVRHQKMISLESNEREKQKLLTNLRVHKLRSKQFYRFMQETPENTVSFCFDLQQVQVLPKVPIGDAFYAQQLSFYSFCVTDISTKNPIFYTWMEHQAGRGCIEIGSALMDFLKKFEFSPNITDLRLFSDGCSGQNKNSHIVHMLMLWLQVYVPKSISSIVLFFPVRGHSYMPADRVFGRIEKLTRAHSIIKTPDQYYNLYSEVGPVRKLGCHWKIYNIKEAVSTLNKVTGISEAKRIIIKRVNNRPVIKTENFYRNDDRSNTFQSLDKKGKKVQNIKFPEIPLAHEIKQKKIKSLEKLLIQLASENWRQDPELEWLSPIISNSEHQRHETQIEEDDDTQDIECECQDDDGGVKL